MQTFKPTRYLKERGAGRKERKKERKELFAIRIYFSFWKMFATAFREGMTEKNKNRLSHVKIKRARPFQNYA